MTPEQEQKERLFATGSADAQNAALAAEHMTEAEIGAMMERRLVVASADEQSLLLARHGLACTGRLNN